MYLICEIVLLINLFIITYGAVGREVAPTHPDYPGKCYSELTKQTYYPSEFFFPTDRCARYTCEKANDTDLLFVIFSCGAVAPPEGGSLYKGRVKKRYPECCPKVAIG